MNPSVIMVRPPALCVVPTSEDLRDCGLLSGTTFIYTFYWGMQPMVVLPLDANDLKASDVVTDARTMIRTDFAHIMTLCGTGQLLPVKILSASRWTPTTSRPMSPSM